MTKKAERAIKLLKKRVALEEEALKRELLKIRKELVTKRVSFSKRERKFLMQIEEIGDKLEKTTKRLIRILSSRKK